VTSKTHQGPSPVLCSRCPKFGCLYRRRYARADNAPYINNPLAQVRTLVNDYLTDEEQGVMSGRNPISSINDVLREARFSRDKSKVRAPTFVLDGPLRKTL
jgi:hypothetical protein